MAHRILIVNSPYYAHISEELEKGAREALEASGEACEVETHALYERLVGIGMRAEIYSGKRV